MSVYGIILLWYMANQPIVLHRTRPVFEVEEPMYSAFATPSPDPFDSDFIVDTKDNE